MQEENNTKSSLVWVNFDSTTDLGKALNLKEEVYLPYLLEGEECDQFNVKMSSVKLKEKHLLYGLIMGYKNPYPFGNHKKSISYFHSVLQMLVERFNAKSAEQLLLSALHGFLNRHNSRKIMQAFEGCIFLSPESSKIKFDYCYYAWQLYEMDEISEELTKNILKQYIPQVDGAEINPEALGALDELSNWLGNNH